MLPKRKRGSDSIAAIRKKKNAPIMDILLAATAAGIFSAWTSVTITGVSSRPMLAEVATSALATAPGSPNPLTTVSSRNVVPAVSRTPLQIARRCSSLKVTLVRSARFIQGGHYSGKLMIGD